MTALSDREAAALYRVSRAIRECAARCDAEWSELDAAAPGGFDQAFLCGVVADYIGAGLTPAGSRYLCDLLTPAPKRESWLEVARGILAA